MTLMTHPNIPGSEFDSPESAVPHPQAARPFLAPAADAKREAAVREIDQAGEQELRRTGWR